MISARSLFPRLTRKSRSFSAHHRRDLFRLRFEPLEPRLALAALLVVNANDGGPGSLRDAVEFSNASPESDEIQFALPAGTNQIDVGDEIVITGDLLISGPGADQLTLDGGGTARIFRVEEPIDSEISVEMTGLTFTGGNATDGGAIANFDATLTLRDSVLTGNSADFRGGAIFTSSTENNGGPPGETAATLYLFNTDVTSNTATHGGGIYNDFDHVELLDGSSVSQNQATGDGGGVYTVGNGFRGGGNATLFVIDSHVDNNTAVNGGGIYGDRDFVQIRNHSSVSGNTADGGDGGGIYNWGGQIDVNESSVIENNTAREGGGIYTTNPFNVFVNVFVGLSTLKNNRALGAPGTLSRGGAIFNQGSQVNVFLSTLEGNQAIGANATGSDTGGDAWGGAIYQGVATFEAQTIVQSTTVKGNIARGGDSEAGVGGEGYGGALYANSDRFLVYFSTLSENEAHGGTGGGGLGEAEGGAIWSSTPRLDMLNSTISGNLSDGDGGGIYLGDVGSDPPVVLRHITITNNRADADGDGDGDGGGLIHDGTSSLLIANTIVSGNFVGIGNSASDLVGPVLHPDSSGNLIGGNAGLLPLANNGGNTFTHALNGLSPAVDNGDPSQTAFAFDQRSFPRDSQPDIGAYEVAFDFGDAPISFPVIRRVEPDLDGARHRLDNGLRLGTFIDAEVNGQPSPVPFANNDDDNAPIDDEDGIIFRSSSVAGFNGEIEVQSSGAGFVNAWMDVDGSGNWEADEQILTNAPVSAGRNILNYVVPELPPVAAGENSVVTAFARFRLSSSPGLGTTGPAADGEVEDYSLTVELVREPDEIEGEEFEFEENVPPRRRRWYDPEIAYGYDYEIDPTNPNADNFTSVELLSGFGDNNFTIHLFDELNNRYSATPIAAVTAPMTFDFEANGHVGGVSKFRILGIELSAGLSPDDPLAFATGLAFADADNDNTSIVDFSMEPLSTPNVANDDVTTTEDSQASGDVLANDNDRNGDPLTAKVVDDVDHGILVLNSDGTFTYTPDTNFHGNDRFTYQANDGLQDSDIATVEIVVESLNDDPVARDDSYETNQNQTLNVAVPGVLGNDNDVDGDDLDVAIVSPPTNGTLELNVLDGSFSYTPNPNFQGTDKFTYQADDGPARSNAATVTITVLGGNSAPEAENDSYTVNEDKILNVPARGVLTNDTDDDGDPISAVIKTDPSHGTVTLRADGSFRYTPEANFHGTDTFTYVANDGTDDSNVATVTVTVRPVNDAPVAVDDSYAVNAGSTLIILAPGVLGNDNDVDGDSLSAIAATAPKHGTLTLNANGSFRYQPTKGYSGSDSFQYKVSDGKLKSANAVVRITVSAVPKPSIEVKTDPLDPKKQALVVTGTPNNDSIQFIEQHGNKVSVRANGVVYGPFSKIDTLIAYGRNGNDTITVGLSVDIQARLYGEAGNDVLRANAGKNLLHGGIGMDALFGSFGHSNILVGGADADLLVGGISARNVVIGGDGTDVVAGGLLEDNILIGGKTTHDNNDAALMSILNEWSSNRKFSDRVKRLKSGGGANGSNVLVIRSTVLDDSNAQDELIGGTEADWFFEFPNDKIVGKGKDDIVDK